MHIAIDARVINSGTGTYIYKLLEYLQQIDTTNHYSVLVRPKDRDYWHPTNKNFSVVEADFENFSFGEQIGFKRLLDNLQPDLVHFCMPQQPVFYSGKVVTTVHDLTLFKTYNTAKSWFTYHAKQLVGQWVFRRIAKKSTTIITISNSTRDDYKNFTSISDSKLVTIYEAADSTPGKLKRYQLPFDEYVVYVGRHTEHKNVISLAKSHQLLLEKYPRLGLVFVGRLDKELVRNKSQFEGEGYKNILFTGYTTDPERDWILSNAKAYVFPSLMEGFGLPPLEAMAYGTPVVSSNTSCMPEILGDAAEYFDPLDIDDMAQAIERVITDETLRKRMIKKGHTQVAKYSWRRMAEETHAVYMKALSSKR